MRSDYRPDSVSLVSTDCVRWKSVTERSVRVRGSYTLRSSVMVLQSCPATQSRLWVRERLYHLCELFLALLALVCRIILSTVFTQLSDGNILSLRPQFSPSSPHLLPPRPFSVYTSHLNSFTIRPFLSSICLLRFFRLESPRSNADLSVLPSYFQPPTNQSYLVYFS